VICGGDDVEVWTQNMLEEAQKAAARLVGEPTNRMRVLMVFLPSSQWFQVSSMRDKMWGRIAHVSKLRRDIIYFERGGWILLPLVREGAVDIILGPNWILLK
jgi:hypothetical protein